MSIINTIMGWLKGVKPFFLDGLSEEEQRNNPFAPPAEVTPGELWMQTRKADFVGQVIETLNQATNLQWRAECSFDREQNQVTILARLADAERIDPNHPAFTGTGMLMNSQQPTTYAGDNQPTFCGCMLYSENQLQKAGYSAREMPNLFVSMPPNTSEFSQIQPMLRQMLGSCGFEGVVHAYREAAPPPRQIG